MNIKRKICQISTAHPQNDVRIFHKECKALLDYGHTVFLVVQAKSDQNFEGINIVSIPLVKSRLKRMFFLTRNAYKKAINLDAEIYHLHDPELIPIGMKLKKRNKKVIFDIHEDISAQILSKDYIPKILRQPISKAYTFYEKNKIYKFDALICATPAIKKKYDDINEKVIVINNYPILGELVSTVDWKKREDAIAYIGGITKIRGIMQLVEALNFVNAKLYLAGNFESSKFQEQVMSLKGWNKVEYLGSIDRKTVKEILTKVKAGVVTFLPEPNHIKSLPNKLFEYMSAGIPVIASNFSHWKDIVEKRKLGICVNPKEPKEIALAINSILYDPNAEKMGINGRKAIEEEFNWEIEKAKLISLYEYLLG